MTHTILITGATDGIGLATARALATQGHKVLLHGRNPDKLAQVTAELQALPGVPTLHSYVADLSDLEQVKTLAEAVLAEHCTLDVLINNAGIFRATETVTRQGLELRFAVNTFAPVLLTHLLQPLFSTTSRVINLSSAAQAPVNLDALAGRQAVENDFEVYAQSKLALTIWTRQTAQNQGADGPQLIAVNPGSMLASKMVQQGFGVAGNDLSIGVDILCRAALSEEFAQPEGRYFDNDSGQFSEPLEDAQNSSKVADVMEIIHTITERYST